MLSAIFVIIGLATLVSSFSVQLNENTESEPFSGFSSTTEATKNDCDSLCLTPECVHAASRALKRMDFSVNPCDDFYDFACGNFVKETVIPDDKQEVDMVSIVQDKITGQLLSLMNDDIDSSAPAPFQMVKKLYNACMNESLIEKHGLAPLLGIMQQLGGWPVVEGDQWDENNAWNWTWATKELHKIGYSADYIIEIEVDTTIVNSTAHFIHIGKGAPISEYHHVAKLDEKNLEAYRTYMIDTAVAFGADRLRAEEELNETLQFDLTLSAFHISSEVEYKISRIGKVQEKYPFVEWLDYINAMLPEPLSVNESEKVIVKEPEYLENLGQLLSNTSNRVIANYLMWRMTEYSLSFLTEDLRQLKFEYAKVGSGQKQVQELWKSCIDSVGTGFPIAVSSMYVRKYFREKSKAAIFQLTTELRKEFERTFREAPWMDDETREAMLDKLAKMHTLVGYADELIDDSKIEKYHEKLEIDDSNYLSFVLSVNLFNDKISSGRLRQAVNKSDWETRQPTFKVNAFYLVRENGIQFPAAILQDHFFSADRPQYLNFGAIGAVIGHEITHAFDDTGKLFDSNGDFGDVFQRDDDFEDKAECIIMQYGSYTDPLTGKNVNGFKTMSENMADIGGLKISYEAFIKWNKEHAPEPMLPGLDYTPQQMFWITEAQTWCSVSRVEAIKKQIAEKTHTPNKFRVLGPFSNLKAFANDFQCPEGSPMNPVSKCSVF